MMHFNSFVVIVYSLVACSNGVTFSPVPLVNPDQIKLGIYWVVPLSGVGLRVGTQAVGGLGTVTHLNERDIMKENGRVCERETISAVLSQEKRL